MKTSLSLGFAVVLAFGAANSIIACSDSSSDGSSGDGGSSSATDSGGNATDSGSSGSKDSGGGGTSDSGGGGTLDSGGGATALVNGCTSFADDTASGVSNLAWGFGIMSDANHCAHIHTGQTVKWSGDFGTHPLAAHDDRADAGGGSPNPITSGAVVTDSSVTITFPNPGIYGYWCTVHQTMMMGAIVVD